MDALVVNFGYLGLMIVSYLGSTVLPLSSEVVILPMLALDYNLWLIIISASVGSVLGSSTNYAIGYSGRKFVFERFVDDENAPNVQRARRWFDRWGAPLLLGCWLPIIGDAITLASGLLKVPPRLFVPWVVVGHTTRYVVMLVAVHRWFFSG